MDNYNIKSTSAYSGRLTAPIVVEESLTTRKVLYVDLNDKKVGEGETVGIKIVHQRRRRNDEWDDVQSVNLNSLRGGEGVKLDLSSKTTRKIYDELTKLYALVKEKGIESGENKFTIGRASEIIKVPKDRKVLIERLLKDNHADEVWSELVKSDPDLATRLSWARLQANRANALQVFKENLAANADESFWQRFFFENDWIFGYGLNYQFLHVLNDQPDYGGRSHSGKGSQKGDYLMHTKANSKFTVLVEIKTPATKLLSYQKGTSKPQTVRNDVWLLSSSLLGAISQIQVNARTWSIDSQRGENIRLLENHNIYTIEPKGILVIGSTAEFQSNESIISCFESYRRNTFNPEIITFDELYERAKFIIENKAVTESTIEDSGTDDLPF